jgi:hypothetical protein
MKWKNALMIAGGVAVGTVVARTVWRTLKGPDKPNLGRKALVGKECVITSQSVDDTFGQARIEDNGAGLILSVRCHNANELTKGSLARVTAYHEGTDAYDVEPIH